MTSSSKPLQPRTPFRRAVEEGLLDPKMVQIGIRGAISDADNYDFAHEAGIRMIHRGVWRVA